MGRISLIDSNVNPESIARESWGESELEALAAAHPQGLSTQQIVELFAGRGEPLSEATFRKYVQLGLLPRSVRVGRKGKHRGSQGLYPVTVVGQVDLIRRLMASGYTIGEIQREFMCVGSEIEGLSKQLSSLLSSIEQALAPETTGGHVDEVLNRALAEVKELSDTLLARLREIERRLVMRARMARAAV